MQFTGKRKCYSCDGWFLPPDEIDFGADPFRAEIRGDYTPRWLCNSCHYNSRMEI